MPERNDHRELAARLNEERERLQHARTQYETITSSRFHALRMLWFSFKRLFGKSSSDDVFAVWSTASPIELPPGRIQTSGAALPKVEQALVEAWNARIAARPQQTPLVTVVIPVFNQRAVTARCLQSIATSWFESLPVQFVVVDDGSTDDTAALITKIQGIDYVYNGRNEGFVHACNRGAQLAHGKYICFLNNDTVVRDGWLDYLVNTVERDETIGVVGSKLVYPDDRLQEAGSIIWRDATGWNVGRNENSNDPRYNFLRDVDYVSGAALLVRRDLFFRAGGFSDEFRPAYYEDVDLCFKVRALGSRVVYQPRSVVVHYEGVTSGNERTGVKRFQEINRPKFRDKWASRLANHLPNDRANVPMAMLSHSRGRTVLLVDSYVPMHDREAGSRRMFHIINILLAAGYKVVFLPDNFAPAQPYTEELQQMGVQVLHHVDGGLTLQEALEQVLPLIGAAWISRPELYTKYAPIIRKRNTIRLIYDTVDLHHVRKQRESALSGEGDAAWLEWQRIESDAARNADATVVVTAEEESILRALGIDHVFIVPTIHVPARVPNRRFEDTSGLLFVGNYNHPPNGDAAQWLCQSIMPLIWNALPEVHLTLAGSNPDDALRGLRSDRVSVTGYVPDITPYFRKTRLFVAPLRFGAGMKGKIGQALEYGVPVVTTPIGAEGFDLRDGENAIIAQADAQAFADAILALYNDRESWQRISRQAEKALQPFTPALVAPKIQAVLAGVG